MPRSSATVTCNGCLEAADVLDVCPRHRQHGLCRSCFSAYCDLAAREFAVRQPLRCWCEADIDLAAVERFLGAEARRTQEAALARMRASVALEAESAHGGGGGGEGQGGRRAITPASTDEEIAAAVDAAMAEGACVRCPECNEPWRKDLSCTHVRCGKCSTRFCYHCGEAARNNFLEHNSRWVCFAADEKEERATGCPIYLKYRYGTRSVANRYDGEPAVALRRFHAAKQLALVAEIERAAGRDVLGSGPALFEAEDIAFFEAHARKVAAERERVAAVERARLEAERILREEREAEERAREERELQFRQRHEERRRNLRAFIENRRRALRG